MIMCHSVANALVPRTHPTFRSLSSVGPHSTDICNTSVHRSKIALIVSQSQNPTYMDKLTFTIVSFLTPRENGASCYLAEMRRIGRRLSLAPYT